MRREGRPTFPGKETDILPPAKESAMHIILCVWGYWHVYSKILRHTGQNAIAQGNLEYILTRLL